MLNAAAVPVPPEPRRRARRLLAAHAVAAGVLIGLLTGCSGTISPPSNATGATGRPTSTAPALPGQPVRPSSSAAVSANKTLLKYVTCVAKHGGGNLAGLAGGATPKPSQKPVSAAQAKRAAQACQGLLKTAFSGTATVSSGQAALNAWAHCMASHGVQVQPDLQAVKFLKLSDPKISAAMSKCRSLLPKATASPTPTASSH
jgi:hypothetical protein